MCRFLLFSGKQPARLCDLLTNPVHSIIKQSYDSRLRVDDTRPLNGDGFGVGWYVEGDATPCVFTSVMPAWNNPNLLRLADKIKSNLVFAHVRAASANTPISESNCHPWAYLNYMWMHNGYVADFVKIRRRLHQSLRDDLYNMITGNTDSEQLFALFLSQLEPPLERDIALEELREALLQTIRLLNEWCREAGIMQPSLLNMAVSNGKCVIATRYNSRIPSEAATLFYSSGTRFECVRPGHYRMSLLLLLDRLAPQIKADRRDNLVIVASEPTTFEKLDWLMVPENSMICIDEKHNVLLYPIPDLIVGEQIVRAAVDACGRPIASVYS